MHYQVIGEGETVILIHGLFGSLDNLQNLAKSLQHKYQVIMIDLPNHGLSHHQATMQYDDLASQVTDLISELNLSSVHCIGHSMGGKVAMATALTYPQLITSLIVVDIAPVSYEPSHLSVFSALHAIKLEDIQNRQQALSVLLDHKIEPNTANFLLKNLIRCQSNEPTLFKWKMNLDGLYQSYLNIIDWPYHQNGVLDIQLFSEYTKPTLFIKGENSDYILPSYQNEIVTQFPQAQFSTIPNSGHWVHAENPLLFNQQVNNFLANVCR